MDVQGTRYHEASVEDDIDDLNDETFGDGAIGQSHTYKNDAVYMTM